MGLSLVGSEAQSDFLDIIAQNKEGSYICWCNRAVIALELIKGNR